MFSSRIDFKIGARFCCRLFRFGIFHFYFFVLKIKSKKNQNKIIFKIKYKTCVVVVFVVGHFKKDEEENQREGNDLGESENGESLTLLGYS